MIHAKAVEWIGRYLKGNMTKGFIMEPDPNKGMGGLEMAKIHKYPPRTKHLNVKLYHFRTYVTNGDIDIVPIETTNQQADYRQNQLV